MDFVNRIIIMIVGIQGKKIGSRMRLARHFAELISDIFRSIDGGHDPRYGIWNHSLCLLCQRVILSEFTQR